MGIARRDLLTAGALAAAGGALPARATAPELDRAVRRGIAYLRARQGTDGAWQRYPGITAVCLLGLLRNGVRATDPAAVRAAAYLAGLQKPTGAIFTDQFGPAQALPNYNTALSLTALHATRLPRFAPLVKKAQEFLSASQFDEGEGFTRADPQYGGIGYGSRADNPDLSNLQNALEALRETGHPRDAEVFRKAVIFLQRCQNRKESNDQPWAGTDGGFVYASSGESKADEYTRRRHSSYGSMTYAGLKSYLYCNVTRTDPRVTAAWEWLRANYDVEQNPRMGTDGLFYYYHTMAKTLAVWGQKVITDAAGRRRAWAPDLTAALVKRQAADGSWKNSNPRWREDDPALVTGYSLLALANCRRWL